MAGAGEIEAAIDRLKGRYGVFERLAAGWASISFGKRFSGLEIRGRRSDMTVPGWPDAVVERKDGSWDCLEATHSQDWRRHLRGDVERMRDLDVSGFVFVAWCAQPDQATLADARRLVAATGVPEEAIEFVFRGRLLESLCRPVFAQLCQEVLGVSNVAFPFRPVDAQRGLVGVDASSESLHPPAAEFHAGRVHRPSVLPKIERQLARAGQVEVRGRGAAGKTVLAEHIARRHLGAGYGLAPRPVYYVKLGAMEQLSRYGDSLVEAFLRKADKDVLFIVDDTHLDPQAAHDLRLAWEDHPHASRLLLLGREQEIERDLSVLPARLEGNTPRKRIVVGEQSTSVITLVVERRDLLGIYRRLALLQGVEDPPDPPRATTYNWLQLFRGDLVVFSAAVASKMDRLLEGEWALTEEDAAFRVAERYLQPSLEPTEQGDLLCLAALWRSELGVPAQIVRSGFQESIKRGAVVRMRLDAADAGEFHLAHAGLGRMLLAAAHDPSDPKQLLAWAKADEHIAVRLGLHMWDELKYELAESCWRAAMEPGRGFGLALLSLPLGMAQRVLRAIDSAGPYRRWEIDARLASEAKDIARVLASRPEALWRGLAILRRGSREAWDKLLDELDDDDLAGDLIASLSLLDQHRASSRLSLLLQKGKPRIEGILGRRLNNSKVLLLWLRSSDDFTRMLGDHSFERVLKSAPGFSSAFWKVLADEPGLEEKIIDGVVTGSLPHLPQAIRLLNQFLPELSASIGDRLAATDVQRQIGHRANELSAAQLIGLVKFAHALDPQFAAVVEAGINARSRARLATRANSTELRGFEKAADMSPLMDELADRAAAAQA